MPQLKLGATQLLGHYVVDTLAQFEAAAAGVDVIEASLRDTSVGIDAIAILNAAAKEVE